MAFEWVADRLPGAPEAEDEERQVGPVIRFMWDHGCVVPLWDTDGPLAEDPDWLAAEVGVSRRLFDDMSAWTADQKDGNLGPEHTMEAERLFARLRAEVPPRFKLVNQESRRAVARRRLLDGLHSRGDQRRVRRESTSGDAHDGRELLGGD